MATTRFDHTCPYCDTTNDAATGLNGADVPEPGALSICWTCKAISIFTETGIRKPTADEAESIFRDPGVRSALAAVSESYTPFEAADLTNRGGA